MSVMCTKQPGILLEMLVDIVSKNGNLLLNIPQQPDGSLDDECEHLLTTMAAWMGPNGAGVFGSRPWKIASEGPSLLKPTTRYDEPALAWSAADFRFTQKGEVVYAYQMRWPEDGQTVIRSFASGQVPPVARVDLLGYGNVAFEQTMTKGFRSHCRSGNRLKDRTAFCGRPGLRARCIVVGFALAVRNRPQKKYILALRSLR